MVSLEIGTPGETVPDERRESYDSQPYLEKDGRLKQHSREDNYPGGSYKKSRGMSLYKAKISRACRPGLSAGSQHR